MSDHWRDGYRRDASDVLGEARWTLWKIFWLIVGLVVVLSVTGYVLGWFSEGAKVAQEEFGPRAALHKYEWFIEKAAAIAKMDQDIKLFEKRIGDVRTQYAGYGEDMAKWPPDVRVQFNHASQQARDDLVAVVSQRNNLVREYNAASDKFNWAPFQTRPDKPTTRFHEYVVR